MLAAVVSVSCAVNCKEFRAARKLRRYKHYWSRLLIYFLIYDDGCELRPSRA